MPGTFTCISDSEVEDFSLAEMLANPQQPVEAAEREGGYQVYMLCYIREDAGRRMPVAPRVGKRGKGRGRLERELRGLMM